MMTCKTTFLLFLILGFGLMTAAAQTEMPKQINGGVLNGKAKSLVKPVYPAAAQAVKASGAVNVQITIDENGNVIAASAVSGHPLLRQSAEQAARESTFAPTTLSGQPVKVTGVIVYNFVAGGTSWLAEGTRLGIAQNKGIQGKMSLPEGFSSEQEMLDSIASLAADDQKVQLSSVVSSIKSKLNPADLWRFEFGLAKGRIVGNVDNDAEILTNLAKFRELSNNKVIGVQDYEINQAVELAKFADKTALSVEDKKAIFDYLR